MNYRSDFEAVLDFLHGELPDDYGQDDDVCFDFDDLFELRRRLTVTTVTDDEQRIFNAFDEHAVVFLRALTHLRREVRFFVNLCAEKDRELRTLKHLDGEE